MDDIKVAENGGLVFNGYDLVIVSGVEEIAQRMRLRLLSIVGEWAFNPSRGMIHVGEGGIRDMALPREARIAKIRRYMLATPGVTSFVKFDPIFDNENNGLRITYSAMTVYNVATQETTTEVAI